MADMNTGMKLTLGLILILSALLPITLSSVADVTELTTVTNQTYNASTALATTQTELLTDGELGITIHSDVITNSTGTTFTRATDYVIDYDQGTINFSNPSNLNHFINISYSSQPSGFQSGTSATILTLLTVFIVLGALVFIAKTSGLMG